jgi:hypothetical protein
MEQRNNRGNSAALKDAQIKSSVEECVEGTMCKYKWCIYWI